MRMSKYGQSSLHEAGGHLEPLSDTGESRAVISLACIQVVSNSTLSDSLVGQNMY